VVVLIAQVLTTNLAEDSTPAEEFTRACLAHTTKPMASCVGFVRTPQAYASQPLAACARDALPLYP
jgi:hypothetical protein